ncbi:MAG: pseudouridine synthase, partial [Acetobacteraceae bacterium]
KTYWAVVFGAPAGDQGTWSAPLLRRSTPDGWRIVIDPAGQEAVTTWRVLGRAGDLTWLELRPRTGRTHQIRVHCSAFAGPILGDAGYGGGDGRLHLLARAIHLPLDPPLDATAEPSGFMHNALGACGWRPVHRFGH